MIIDMFSKTEYDECLILKNQNKVYSLKLIKSIVANKISEFDKNIKNIIILPDDNFSFIINFFAAIFARKTIYLLTEKQKVNEFKKDFFIPSNDYPEEENNYTFPKLDTKDIVINFFTSGSTKEPKTIKKSLFNLIEEGKDVTEALNLSSLSLTVKSSTTYCHLFGMTFGLMFPLCNRYLIDTEKVLYPENINTESCFFVSTPAFLTALKKHSLPFAINPSYIIAAGAKLNDEVFSFFEKDSSVIEIYGSTETGVIAYRTKSSQKELNIFPNVKIENETTVSSNYIYEKEIMLSDNISVKDNKLTVQGRKDRIVKIYDKRVSLDAIEGFINSNDMIESSYCFELNNKLACICIFNEKGKEYLLRNGPNQLKKYLKNYLNKFTDVVPQKWRFNNFIPMTQTGKIDKAFINKLFTVNFSFPIILDVKSTENLIVSTLFFHSNCNFYNGHFPDFPITPGVAQLYIASELSNKYFDINTIAGQIKKIKFSSIIYPNSVVDLSLSKTQLGIEFEYYSQDQKYSSGILPIKNVFKGEDQ